MKRTVVLVSNGPGELQTWVRPVLQEIRSRDPEITTVISLIPCQFAGGNETRLARTFGADHVTSPQDAVAFLAGTARPEGLSGERGAVISMGGNTRMAVSMARKLGFSAYRYSFIPFWHPGLARLYVHDDRAYRKARALGAPADRLEKIGNLVADALAETGPVVAEGSPHIMLLPGSRDRFASAVFPFMQSVADAVAAVHPGAAFTWPVSRLLSEDAVTAAALGTGKEVIGGAGGRMEDGHVITAGGTRIRMAAEEERYGLMKSATMALTIPGTNTLELGIARVPSLVMLPLNRPEIIPLEGPGHWLSLLPVVGIPLKRRAVKLFVERLNYPVSLPNQLSGEKLMTEIRGDLTVEQVSAALLQDLSDPAALELRRERMAATMPGRGAAARLVDGILEALA